ncbi:hypothetical protein [Rossellomorea aquimaris]|nr:hypothetical protein [Rossellomorea aquimaris]
MAGLFSKTAGFLVISAGLFAKAAGLCSISVGFLMVNQNPADPTL